MSLLQIVSLRLLSQAPCVACLQTSSSVVDQVMLLSVVLATLRHPCTRNALCLVASCFTTTCRSFAMSKLARECRKSHLLIDPALLYSVFSVYLLSTSFQNVPTCHMKSCIWCRFVLAFLSKAFEFQLVKVKNGHVVFLCCSCAVETKRWFSLWLKDKFSPAFIRSNSSACAWSLPGIFSGCMACLVFVVNCTTW